VTGYREGLALGGEQGAEVERGVVDGRKKSCNRGLRSEAECGHEWVWRREWWKEE
jgi:hypothetical protein